MKNIKNINCSKTKPSAHPQHIGLLSAILSAFVLGASGANLLSATPASFRSAPRGPFPNPSSYEISYRLGWAGLTAARAEARIWSGPATIAFEGKASTIGLARSLWQLDATLHSTIAARTLRSIRSELIERYSRVTTVITHVYDQNGVDYRKVETPLPEKPAKPRYIEHPDIVDLIGALLRFRSQTLEDGQEVSVVETQGTTLYVATLEVLCRERIRVAGTYWPAICARLRLQRIGKTGQLEAHKKFRRATTWLSDDQDRYVLKIESEVFVGSIFAEMESVRKL